MEIPKIAAFAIPKKIFSQPLEFGDLSPLCQSETCLRHVGEVRRGCAPSGKSEGFAFRSGQGLPRPNALSPLPTFYSSKMLVIKPFQHIV